MDADIIVAIGFEGAEDVDRFRADIKGVLELHGTINARVCGLSTSKDYGVETAEWFAVTLDDPHNIVSVEMAVLRVARDNGQRAVAFTTGTTQVAYTGI